MSAETFVPFLLSFLLGFLDRRVELLVVMSALVGFGITMMAGWLLLWLDVPLAGDVETVDPIGNSIGMTPIVEDHLPFAEP